MKKSHSVHTLAIALISVGLWSSAAHADANIALDKPVTASSSEDSSLSIEQAVDGDPSTRWSSEFRDDYQITIDLEDRYNISGITLHWETAYSEEYEILVSDDGEAWTSVSLITDGDGGEDTIDVSAQARHLRIEGHKRATSWGNSLWEIEVEGEPYVPETNGEVRNLAVGKTAFSSSMEKNSLAPENAFDGDSTTRWSSDHSDNNWITVDLGEVFELTGVRLLWETAYSEDYEVKVSDDGNNWTIAHSVMNSEGGTQELDIIETGRYVRIEGYSRATSWGHSLWEVEVYGRDLSVEPPEPANVSQGKTAYASSRERDSRAAEYAVDGNPDSRWSSDFNDHNWIVVDLGQDHQISQVNLNWEAAYSTVYEVQTSYDGESWTSIHRQEQGSGGQEELNISGHGRFVRIEGLDRATRWGHSLWELEVIGYATEQAEPNDGEQSEPEEQEPDVSEPDEGDSDEGSDPIVEDTQAPTIPGNLSASVNGSTSVALSWSAASDDVEVTSYQVFRNGRLLVELAAPSTGLTDSGLQPGSTHDYSVLAVDSSGNQSPESDTVRVTLEEEVVVQDGNQLEWSIPDHRENGDYLELNEIAGYELRLKVEGEEPRTVIIEDASKTSYSLEGLSGSYEYSIAVFDTNGLYSDFVDLTPAER